METILPVIEHVHDKTLCLASYTLSIGHCNALAKCCRKLDAKFNRLILDNCGVDDSEFATILNGLKSMTDFKKIIYRYNVFHKESLDALAGLLEKKIPNHLEELRIENCKSDTNIIRGLLHLLNQRCMI